MNILLGIPFIMGLFVPFARSKPFPTITDTAYTARLQIVIVDKGKRMFALEKYDETEQKASLTLFTGERAHTTVLDYNKRSVTDVDYDVSTEIANQCGILTMEKVEDMNSTGVKSLFHLFGGWHNRSSKMVPHLFSTKRVFTLDNNNEMAYQGWKIIDEDIEADCWKTTMKLGHGWGTLEVWYYFTPTKWAPAEDDEHSKILPLRIEIKGVKPTGTKIHHYYEYLDFEGSKRLPADAFDMPKGAVCVSGNPEPAITHIMTYSREVVDSHGDVSIADVTYNKQLGLLKIAAPERNVLYDFNSGVRLELKNDTCVVRAIDPDLDSNSQNDGNYVKDIGPVEFWLLNTTHYAEDGHSRTIGANIFDNYFGHKKKLIVYYGTKNWNFMNDGYNPPLSMERGDNHYNFFNFQNTAPIMTFVDDYCDYGAQGDFIDLWFQSDSTISKEELLSVRSVGIMYNAIAHFSEVSVYQVSIFEDALEFYEDSRSLYLGFALDGPPSPHNLYRHKKHKQVAANYLQQKSKTMKQDDYDVIIKKSAEICENTTSKTSFVCRNYDLCRNDDNSFTMKMYSTLPSDVSTVSSSTCDHFSRSVNGKPLASLHSAKSKLKDAIKTGSLRFSIPTKWGNVTFIAITPVGESIDHQGEHDSILDSKFAFVNKNYYMTEKEVIKNTDFTECRRMCYNRGSYCKAWGHCHDTKLCVLSTDFPQKGRPPSTQRFCFIYKRLYVTDFKLTTGLTMLPKSQNVYKNIQDVEDCARKCVENKEYKCESFNYCKDSKKCSLSKTHVYSMTEDRVSNVAPACKHYSNNYLSDFRRSEHTVLSTDDKHSLETVIVSSPEQCAYICRSGTAGKGCVQFDYCSDKKMCRLGSFKTQGHTGYMARINCDIYTLNDAEKVMASGRLTGENKVTTYSDASFGGLAIAMVLMGLVLGAGIIYILHRQRYLNMFVR